VFPFGDVRQGRRTLPRLSRRVSGWLQPKPTGGELGTLISAGLLAGGGRDEPEWEHLKGSNRHRHFWGESGKKVYSTDKITGKFLSVALNRRKSEHTGAGFPLGGRIKGREQLTATSQQKGGYASS